MEAICTRLGIIINGKMKQVGSLGEVLKEDIRYVEIEFKGIKELKTFSKYGKIKSENGINHLRIEEEKNRDKAINEIIKKKGQILSVIPVKKTLEEHFMQAINE